MAFGENAKDNLKKYGGEDYIPRRYVKFPFEGVLVGDEFTGNATFGKREGKDVKFYDPTGAFAFCVRVYRTDIEEGSDDAQVQVLDHGKNVYKHLIDFFKSEGCDVHGTVIRVDQKGAGKGTYYEVTKVGDVGPETAKIIEGAEKPNLPPWTEEQKAAQVKGKAYTEQDNEMPF